MKKLMIATAAVTLAVAAQAGIAIRTVDCGGSNPSCPEIVFKVTGSGKATDPISKDYTTVGKLKVNGWLVLFPEVVGKDANGNDACCYPWYSLYIAAKIGKNTTNLIIAGNDEEAIDSWSLYGSKLDAAQESLTMTDHSKTKKYKLESQLGISGNWLTGNGYSSSTIVYAEDIEAQGNVPAIAFFADAFGKATWKTNVKPGCQKCDKASLDGYEITPGSYSGWFAGVYEADYDAECMNCTCGFGIFGGTWKAKYQTKVSTWEAAAQNLFGAKAVADLKAEGIE